MTNRQFISPLLLCGLLAACGSANDLVADKGADSNNAVIGKLDLPDSGGDTLRFAADNFSYCPVVFTALEDVGISLPDGWLQSAEIPEGYIRAGQTDTFYVAPTGPAMHQRTAAIIFTGRQSGKSLSLTLLQASQPLTDGLPARWYYSKEFANDCGWTSQAAAPANYGNGARSAVVTAVGTNNRRLGHEIATTYKQSVATSNLYTGDYLLFSVPVRSLPAATDVDFMLTISGNDNDAPKYWIAEIWDGTAWQKPKAADLKQVDGEDYSFYTKFYKSYNHCTFLQSFTLPEALTDDYVRIRCRVVGHRNGADGELSPTNTGAVYLPSHEFPFCTIAAYPGIPLKDTKKVAIFGNSFTHYFATAYMLKELARSQGHGLDVRINVKGAQYLRNHLELERSIDVTNEGGYDFALLQDQSTQHSTYADKADPAILSETEALSARLRAKSPSATIILENTWAYPKTDWQGYGSAEAFEGKLLTGAKAVAAADKNIDCVSPIGVAFNKAWAEGLTDLWYSDDKHPNRNGSYLKACVNYLVIFGTPFDDRAANCDVEPATAARLRSIAEATVLGHEAEYSIKR